MELIDTHCHLTFKGLAEEVDAVLDRSRAAGVTKWITVGTDAEENRKVVALAAEYEGVYAAVGIHPHDAKTVGADNLEQLKKLAGEDKVAAIGETGLDFHYNFSKQADQKRVFAEHLRIAAETDLPVIVHSREAFAQTLEILDGFEGSLGKVVFHCFSGSAQEAQAVIDRGFYVSFTGVVTFKNAEKTRAAAVVVPVERLMVETDCPYMSPEPMRRQKVNEPALMVHTARRLAQLKEMTLEDFAEKVTAVSRDFFGIV